MTSAGATGGMSDGTRPVIGPPLQFRRNGALTTRESAMGHGVPASWSEHRQTVSFLPNPRVPVLGRSSVCSLSPVFSGGRRGDRQVLSAATSGPLSVPTLVARQTNAACNAGLLSGAMASWAFLGILGTTSTWNWLRILDVAVAGGCHDIRDKRCPRRCVESAAHEQSLARCAGP
jgi:hypothetical protein